MKQTPTTRNVIERKMTTRSTLRLPREHGAWAMLYVPFAVGTLVAWSLSVRLILLALSMTFVFIARESVLEWWRARARGRADSGAAIFATAYLAAGVTCSAPLVLLYKLYWLLAAALLAAVLLVLNAAKAVRREDRSIGGEMLGIAGLTLTAPAAYYVERGALDSTALWLWALCALYFASSVFYVKLRVHTLNARKEDARRKSWQRCAAYHTFLLLSLVALAFSGSLSAFAIAAFSPVLIRSFWYLAKPVRKISLQRVGWLEVVYSVLFLLFTTLTFHH